VLKMIRCQTCSYVVLYSTCSYSSGQVGYTCMLFKYLILARFMHVWSGKNAFVIQIFAQFGTSGSVVLVETPRRNILVRF